MAKEVKKVVAPKKSTALAAVPDAADVALLNNLFPTEDGFQRTFLPRLGMFSQNKFEIDKKTKKAVLIQEAGMFFIEKQDEEETEQEDGTMKRAFVKHLLGTDPIQGIIVYVRKQLSLYDSATETYTSSPIYDEETEIIPLFANKAEVAKGTVAELKALYPGTSRTGKPMSKLKDNRILYVLFQAPEDEEPQLYQLNIAGTSMYAFKDYAKKVRPNVPLVLTEFSSIEKEQGDTEWNQMTFTKVRDLNATETKDVVTHVQEMSQAIADEKARFADKNAADAQWNEMTASKPEALPAGDE